MCRAVTFKSFPVLQYSADFIFSFPLWSLRLLRSLVILSRLTTKPTKWLCDQRRLRSAWASAQSVADSEDSDQTGRMPRLIWVFAWRTVILLVVSCCGSIMLTYFSPAHKQSLLFFSSQDFALAPNYPFYFFPFVTSLRTTISRRARYLPSALHLLQRRMISSNTVRHTNWEYLQLSELHLEKTSSEFSDTEI